MSGEQRNMVAEAIRVYKEVIRPEIAKSTPFWPLGMPRWGDPWIALGLRSSGASYLTVWRRGPQPAAQITLPVPHLRGTHVTAEVLYPRDTGAEASWNPGPGVLTVTLPRHPSACVLRLG
jgi:alpha-galactosidase